MTTATAIDLRSQVIERIGDVNDQTPETMGNFVGRLRAYASLLGRRDVNSVTVDQGIQIVATAIGDLQAVSSLPAPESSDAQLRAHVAAQRRALMRLENIERTVNADTEPSLTLPSVVTVCRYGKHKNGEVEIFIPKQLTVIDLFELANDETIRLGIQPAVFPGDLEWYPGRTGAAKSCDQDRLITIKPFVEKSVGKSMSRMTRFGAQIPEIEYLALANALEWVSSNGTIDNFGGHRVRANFPCTELSRYEGKGVRRYHTIRGDMDYGVYAGWSVGKMSLV